MLLHASTQTLPVFGTNEPDNHSRSMTSMDNTNSIGGTIPTLQEITGDFIRRQVKEERDDIIRKHSEIFDNKRHELDLRREELQRQLQEVEEQIKSVEIDCHKDMLIELDKFDMERQPEVLDVLTDTGQLDRICPLCEQYFRSSTELPACCLGPEQCHMHTVQRCCFSCSRLSFYDIVQSVAHNEDKTKRNSDDEIEGFGIENDLATLETAAATPSWMLEQIFGEGTGLIGEENDDEYEDSAATIAAEVMRLVPSESGSVTCPVCHNHYCDHDFLFHYAACCRQAQSNEHDIFVCLECNE